MRVAKETKSKARGMMYDLARTLGIDDESIDISISRDPVFDIQWIHINNSINNVLVQGNIKTYALLVDRREAIILSKFELPTSYWTRRYIIAEMYDQEIKEAQKMDNTFMVELLLYEKYKQIELLQDEYIRDIYPLTIELREVSFE